MRVNVITPWYPDYAIPYSGVFVHKQVEALRRLGHQILVEVPLIYPAPPGPIPEVLPEAIRTLATSSLRAMYPEEGGATFIPTPVPARSGYFGRAVAMADALRIKREFEFEPADVTHAHLGVPTAWAATRLSREQPLVVTEHQSTLGRVLAEREAAEAYREAIEASQAFFCVSQHLVDQIARALGDWTRERVSVMPNIVDLTDIRFRDGLDYDFKSWVYLGGLFPHKGIQTLLRSFVAYRREVDDSATLTIAGTGPMRNWIERFAAARGISAAIELAGAVPHAQVGVLLNAADVLVHLSPAETFGIASLEGIGAGLPVVSLRNGGAEGAWGDMERECGLLLDAGTDPSEIASAIAKLRSNPDRLDPKRGRRMVEERFAPEVIANRLADTYRAVLG